MTVAIIAGHAFLELVVGKMGNQLREDGSAGIHSPLFRQQRRRPHLDRFCTLLVQSFFGGTPANSLISRDFSTNEKCFTGHQRIVE
jgi:hypothetical protein